MLFSFLAAMIAIGAPAESALPAPEFAVGQVWQYQHRPQDQGSLLKIQRTELLGTEQVYHISVIGVRVGDHVTAIQHLPVSRETLQRSVTKLATDPGTFPSADEGIEIWRKDQGGVFTISIAEIADFSEGAMGGLPN